MLQAWLHKGKAPDPGNASAKKTPAKRAAPEKKAAPASKVAPGGKAVLPAGGVEKAARGGKSARGGKVAKGSALQEESEVATPLREEPVADTGSATLASPAKAKLPVASPAKSRTPQKKVEEEGPPVEVVKSPTRATPTRKASTQRSPAGKRSEEQEADVKGEEEKAGDEKAREEAGTKGKKGKKAEISNEHAGKEDAGGEEIAGEGKEAAGGDDNAREEENEAGKEGEEGGVTGDENMCDYEKQRAQNIRRNRAILESLDIPSLPAPPPADPTNIRRNRAILESLDIPSLPAPPPADPSAPRQRTGGKRKPGLVFETERRTSSRRVATLEGNKEALQALPDGWDDRDEAAAARAGRTQAVRKPALFEEEDPDCSNLVPPPDMEEFLEELAERQGEAMARYRAEAPTKGGVVDWQAFAEEKWGTLVRRSKTEDWESFVSSRCPVHPGAEGSGMLQERFCGDVWRLLLSCILMSRVSSADTKDKCLAAFFEAYPTPSAFKVADDQDIFPLIKPLGLFDSRIKGLRDVTLRFLEMPRFMLGLAKPLKPMGIGVFGYESYLIFSCGEGKRIKADDKNLAGYCSWLRRTLSGVVETAEEDA